MALSVHQLQIPALKRVIEFLNHRAGDGQECPSYMAVGWTFLSDTPNPRQPLMVQDELIAIEQGPEHILPKAQGILVFHRRGPVDSHDV